ncbi:MAG: hypothetical protein LBJ41_11240 [Treponema sp.]|nr:hypothetical protein [Treponema sp.]
MNKSIAPIIVTIFLITYCIIYGVVIITVAIPSIIKIGGFAVIIIISIVMIMMLVERIKEIKGGEEDDLSKY